MALNYPNKGFCRRFRAGLRQAINKSIVNSVYCYEQHSTTLLVLAVALASVLDSFVPTTLRKLFLCNWSLRAALGEAF